MRDLCWLCADWYRCRGDCARYMAETAADRNAVKGKIAALGDKKSRPKAAEQKEDKYGHKMEDVEPVTQ